MRRSITFFKPLLLLPACCAEAGTPEWLAFYINGSRNNHGGNERFLEQYEGRRFIQVACATWIAKQAGLIPFFSEMSVGEAKNYCFALAYENYRIHGHDSNHFQLIDILRNNHPVFSSTTGFNFAMQQVPQIVFVRQHGIEAYESKIAPPSFRAP